MDSIEDNIRLLLQGKGIDENQGLCDFTLEDQNDLSGKLIITNKTFPGWQENCVYMP